MQLHCRVKPSALARVLWDLHSPVNLPRAEDVPGAAWTFPIGGYLPAQKWLKDRKCRALTFDDVRHSARIVKILLETDWIMRGIGMDLA